MRKEPQNHDLLACPFCGQPPRLKAGKVKCVNVQCKVQPKTSAWYAKGFEQSAVNDWNHRRQANGQPTIEKEQREDYKEYIKLSYKEYVRLCGGVPFRTEGSLHRACSASWRLLADGDKIEAGDQYLEHNCQTWTFLHAREWCIGAIYSNVFVPMRRRMMNAAGERP